LVTLIRDRARQVVRAGGFVVATSAYMGLAAVNAKAFPSPHGDVVTELWTRRWAATLLRLFDIRLEIRGSVPPPTKKGRDRGRLIVANHRSAIDIGVMLATFGGRLVSRADLSGWPVIGAAARMAGTIFVDRQDARSGMITMRLMEKHLKDGDTVTIFPEGTTFPGDEVRPFHGGAFISAARASAEILPVGLAYPEKSDAAFVNETFMSHLNRMSMAPNATRVGVAVGPAIQTLGRKATELTRLAHAAVVEQVAVARELAGP
jgi:1-acyl-sn-glycerol-3-phosphate acyltransferase